jgi:hypothetical protein
VIVLGGRRFEVPGCVDTKNPLDHPGLPWMTDGHARTRRVAAVIIHTTKGRGGALLDAASEPSTQAERYARYQAGTKRDVSWDFTVDLDGTVVQHNDPTGACGERRAPWVAWHAGSANEWSVGVEVVQSESRALYVAQLRVLVALVDFLCEQYGVPRRVPVDAHGAPWSAPIFECVSRKRGGRQQAWEGVLNHCNVTTPDSRGPGDAGPHVRAAFLGGGFARSDVTALVHP